MKAGPADGTRVSDLPNKAVRMGPAKGTRENERTIFGMAGDEKPIEQRTKAALQQSVGQTVKAWNYTDGGNNVVLEFTDGTNLQIETTYDREIEGVQGEIFLMAHFARKK
jgi:hypothetical protein